MGGNFYLILVLFYLFFHTKLLQKLRLRVLTAATESLFSVITWYVTLRYVMLRCVTLHYVTLRYVALRYVTLRCVTLRYITLCYVVVRSLARSWVCLNIGSESNVSFSIKKGNIRVFNYLTGAFMKR